ncbi:hypothetical protein SGL43_00350 [Streptomyces globisporus]|uniref:Uncharacterized protein n=1 Tax=Streptomyces globisporus TaxID=1908 RepID=A0ABM9GPN1_STRGL|nr:hypothetical protein SGL43_00350 [Streptomyces globisporus]
MAARPEPLTPIPVRPRVFGRPHDENENNVLRPIPNGPSRLGDEGKGRTARRRAHVFGISFPR